MSAKDREIFNSIDPISTTDMLSIKELERMAKDGRGVLAHQEDIRALKANILATSKVYNTVAQIDAALETSQDEEYELVNKSQLEVTERRAGGKELLAKTKTEEGRKELRVNARDIEVSRNIADKIKKEFKLSEEEDALRQRFVRAAVYQSRVRGEMSDEQIYEYAEKMARDQFVPAETLAPEQEITGEVSGEQSPETYTMQSPHGEPRVFTHGEIVRAGKVSYQVVGQSGNDIGIQPLNSEGVALGNIVSLENLEGLVEGEVTRTGEIRSTEITTPRETPEVVQEKPVIDPLTAEPKEIISALVAENIAASIQETSTVSGEESLYETFKGNVTATVLNNKEDVLKAKEELSRFMEGKLTSLSNSTIDTLSILGAVTTPKDMVNVFRDKAYQGRIMRDLNKVIVEGVAPVVEETQIVEKPKLQLPDSTFQLRTPEFDTSWRQVLEGGHRQGGQEARARACAGLGRGEELLGFEVRLRRGGHG